MDQDSNVKYTMKLCSSSPDTACGENAAVCAQNLTSSKSQSVGKWEFFSRELRERSLGGRIEQNQTTLQSGIVCLFVLFKCNWKECKNEENIYFLRVVKLLIAAGPLSQPVSARLTLSVG